MQIHKTQIEILRLGSSDYAETWAAMKQYTDLRDAHSPDQLWITEHPPIYTQGLNGRSEHVLDRGDIPLLQVDRGGQVTYHGPGQLVIYCLLDLSRLGLGVKALVTRIENSVIELLGNHGVAAHARAGAPGVYVAQAKVAALGLRIRKGCCYHGLSLNVGMDLEPFTRIDPCGYPGLAVTQLRDLGIDREIRQIGDELAAIMRKNLAPA